MHVPFGARPLCLLTFPSNTARAHASSACIPEMSQVRVNLFLGMCMGFDTERPHLFSEIGLRKFGVGAAKEIRDFAKELPMPMV